MTGFVDHINTANQRVDRGKKYAANLAGKSRLLVTLWSLSKQNYPMPVSSMAVACVAAVFLSFSRRRSSKRAKNGQTKEHAWVEQKIRENWGGGVGRKGFLRSPHPLPLLLIFRTPSRAVSFPSRKFLGTPATQATMAAKEELREV